MTEEKKGIINIHFERNSDTANMYAISIYNNEGEHLYTYQDNTMPIDPTKGIIRTFENKAKKHRAIFSIDNDDGKNILSKIFPVRYPTYRPPTYDSIKNALPEPSDDMAWSYICKIKISGLDVNDIDFLTSLNNRIKVPENTRINLLPKNFLKRYKLFAPEPKEIPYINVSKNIPTDNENCVYAFMKQYKKCKKLINLFNKNEGISLEEIINFVSIKKIKCILYDIVGRIIYHNNLPQNKNFRNFIGVCVNGHFYPINPTFSKISLNKNIVDDKFNVFKEKTNNNITITRNNIMYDKSGCCPIYTDDDGNDNSIDIMFFENLPKNFTPKCEEHIMIKSLIYTDPLISKIKYEYDITKAYFNIAYNIMDKKDEYPIFSVFDTFEEYNQDEINNNYYYTVTDDALNILRLYGYINNLLTGKTLMFFIDNKILDYDDIETYKKYSYKSSWTNIIIRIENIAKYFNLKKTENFKKMSKEEIQEYLKKTPISRDDVFKNVANSFMYINGILGQHTHISKTIINGIDTDKIELEIEALNYEKNEQNFKKNTNIYESPEPSIISTTRTYKYLNNRSIYNKIIDECNLFLLQVLLKTKELNPDAKILKIKTDCIAFDKEVCIPDEYKKYFKVVSLEKNTLNIGMKLDEKEPKKYYINARREYINGVDIRKKYFEELSIFDKNKTYIGPPGTGKTTKIKSKEFDYCATTSNLCAANMHEDAQTLYRLFGLHSPDQLYKQMNKLKNKILWIDEFSMVKKYMWNYIFMVALLNKDNDKKMYITGDINQIKPIGEDKLDIENKILLKIFGKIKPLTEEHRNDADLIKIRDFVLNNDIPTLFNKFEEMNNNNDDYLDCDNNLSYLLNTKAIINSNILHHRKYIFEYKNFKYHVSNGVIVSSRVNMLDLKINKNDRWKIIETTPIGFKIQNINKNTIIEIKNKLMKMFEVAFCITVHSSQGLT